ncbi:MAG TPA: MBL fold metallo-hydrolase [Syntrophomonadaceae bacterium]|nr:MBL fold metallo-hydrolase [Syntrophomonadaceae bacterium]
MDLVKLKGKTYYIKASTNVGVYVFIDNNCLLIDTSFTNGQAKTIDETLKKNNLHLKYIINTHTHLDHCRGNLYFQKNYPQCQVYASEPEKPFMENPYLLAALFCSASPLKSLDHSPRCFPVDYYLETGKQKISEQEFEIIPLSGHTIGQIGVLTPDRVCFLGDSIFSTYTIENYRLPYLFDIGESIKTMHSLLEIDADYFVIGHDEGVFTREELPHLVKRNLANIEKFCTQILELLEQPLTREELVEHLSIKNDLVLNLMEYHLIFSTVSAFLKYLFDEELVTYFVQKGRLFFQCS